MARFFPFLHFSLMATATSGPSTLSPTLLRSIICRNHFNAQSELCKNGTQVESGKTLRTTTTSTSTFAFTSANVVSVPPTLVTTVHITLATKTIISLSVIAVFYVAVVMFLRFKVKLSWSRALACGLRSGHLISHCQIYIYPSPEVPDSVSSDSSVWFMA